MLNPSNRLTASDRFVLTYVCQRFIENNGGETIPSVDVLQAAQQEELSAEDVKASLILLGKEHYLTAHYRMDRNNYPAQTHPASRRLEAHYQSTVEDYDGLERQVASALVDLKYGEGELSKLAQSLGQPPMLIDHFLERFEQQGFIEVRRSGGYAFVSQVFPSLKRALADPS